MAGRHLPKGKSWAAGCLPSQEVMLGTGSQPKSRGWNGVGSEVPSNLSVLQL